MNNSFSHFKYRLGNVGPVGESENKEDGKFILDEYIKLRMTRCELDNIVLNVSITLLEEHKKRIGQILVCYACQSLVI